MQQINSKELCTMIGNDFFDKLDAGTFEITRFNKAFAVVANERPDKVIKVMSFSEFKRANKNDIARTLKRGSIEVIKGYGEENTETCFISRK